MTDIGMMDSSAARTTVSSSGNRNQSSRVAKEFPDSGGFLYTDGGPTSESGYDQSHG